MKIRNLFHEKPCVYSIEVFPPKKGGVLQPKELFPTLKEMGETKPDFISVTYGAGGSSVGAATCEIASYLKHTLNIEPLAHLTCVNSTKQEVESVIDHLKNNEIENILALRGDKAKDGTICKDFTYASDLAKFVLQKGNFSLAGACYPECHSESENLTVDMQNLKYKIDAGVSHLITQLFFDNGAYFRHLNMARKEGYTVPIQAGVMPLVNIRQVQRTVSLTGTSIPSSLSKIISKYEHDEQGFFDAGVDYAINQLRDLIIGGADGVHLYAMNNAKVAKLVYGGICDLL